MKARFFTLLTLGLMAVSLTGCPKPKAQITEEPTADDAQKAQAAEEPSLRGKEYQQVPELVTIYFDLDASSLRDDARQTLQKNYQSSFDNVFGSKYSKMMIHATAGSLIGIGEIALLPLDVLKIKMQTNPAVLQGRGLFQIIRHGR